MPSFSGFPPVFDKDSEVLILGSFPSVKSRAVSFYYGNRQNRFWKTVYSFFGEEYFPELTIPEKKSFLLRRHIALWDICEECDVAGSSDVSIKNYRIADLSAILSKADIKLIILNGAIAYKIFSEKYKDIGVEYVKLSSTSPANPKFNPEEWRKTLNGIFRSDKGA